MLHDLRIAARLLRRTPGFTLVALATLGLGIAANAAIFSVVRGVLLQPLPYHAPDRLVAVWTSTAADPRSAHSAAEFLDLQRENTVFAAIAGYRPESLAVAAGSGTSRQLQGAHATVDFFDIFGVPAIEGRTFSRSLDADAGERYVVLSARTARTLFSGAAAAGSRVRVNGASYTVLGVMPETFDWPAGTALWLSSSRPVPPSPLNFPETERDVRYFDAVARLREGVTHAQAQDELDRFSEILAGRRSGTSEARALRMATIHEFLVGDVREAILLLQAGVGIVLLIGAANVSGLLLARTAARRRELAVRAALGAGSSRMVRALLAESLVLGIGGGLVGLALGRWAVIWLVAALPDGLPRATNISLDGGVAAIMFGVAVLVSVLFGVLPALQGSRTGAMAALRDATRGSSANRARSRAVLVVGQVALTLVLLISAALLATSLYRLQAVESGYGAGDVLTANLSIPQTRYPTPEAQATFYTRLIDAMAARPELARSAIGFPAPLRGDNASGTFSVDVPRPPGAEQPFAYLASVSGAYFDTLGIPLRGRAFAAGDTDSAPPVAIVSAALAERYWPGEDAIGRRLRFGDDASSPWITLIGIAGDVRHIGLSEAPPPVLYLPYTQFTLPFTTIYAASRHDNVTVAAALRGSLGALDRELALDDPTPLTDVVKKSTADASFRTALFSALAGVAFVLAIVGLYGLISYSVTQQRREIGIRIALGAAPARILRTIVGRALALAGIGVVIGVAIALAVSQALAGFLYGVEATAASIYVATSALIVVVALAASYVPARRALGFNPVTALRSE